jgi:hypothetical protein
MGRGGLLVNGRAVVKGSENSVVGYFEKTTASRAGIYILAACTLQEPEPDWPVE